MLLSLVYKATMAELQDKLVVRVKTAIDEVAYLKSFDYGELCLPGFVSGLLSLCFVWFALFQSCRTYVLSSIACGHCSCYQWSGAVGAVRSQNRCHHRG